MHRRHFFKSTAAAAAAGTILARVPGDTASAAAAEDHAAATPAILETYSDRDHRRRLENIRFGHENIHACMRKHLVTSYLPGQCCYNLGEYPCLKPWDPDEWDEQELDKLHQQGIELIQVHEDWNDSQRLFGGNKLAPLNPAGFRRFVDMVHRRGMKLIVYVSSGFFPTDRSGLSPRVGPSARPGRIYYHYACCSPASPGWRAYLLPRLVRILDEYGVDGFYDDLGYAALAGNHLPPTKDEVLAFEESDKCDGALADLLGLIYAEVNRRGGIVKVHYGATNRPLTDLKVYDYLWVGETVTSGDGLREATKNHPPYVVPCLDMSRAKIENEDELYLHSIPYMQFPLLLAGRPFTGQRATIPGIKYPPEKDSSGRGTAAPFGSTIRPIPTARTVTAGGTPCPAVPRPGRRTRAGSSSIGPLVEEGTWAWLEVSDSNLFAQPLPRDVVASVFANRHLYVVLANYGHGPVTIQGRSQYTSLAPQADGPASRWDIPARSLMILQRSANGAERS